MKISKLALSCVAAVAVACSVSTATATELAKWTFEGTPVGVVFTGTDFVYGPADSGSGLSARGHHSDAATVWSFPAGNGSAKSFSSTRWNVNDYWEFSLATTGFNGISIAFDQTSSNTGPRDFSLQWSTTGLPGSFTQFTTYQVSVQSWSSAGSPNVASHYSFDLSSVSALNNQATVFFRLVDTSTTSANGATVTTAGSDRVDNFTVNGATAIPEPTTVLGGLLTLGALGWHQRRRLGRLAGVRIA